MGTSLTQINFLLLSTMLLILMRLQDVHNNQVNFMTYLDSMIYLLSRGGETALNRHGQ